MLFGSAAAVVAGVACSDSASSGDGGADAGPVAVDAADGGIDSGPIAVDAAYGGPAFDSGPIAVDAAYGGPPRFDAGPADSGGD